jgi:hypothetical protein
MKPLTLQSIHKTMPNPQSREYLRQVTSRDALFELDARLSVWKDEDPFDEGPHFPSVPDTLPQRSTARSSGFDWGRYAESLERSRKRRLENPPDTADPVRQYHAASHQRHVDLSDNDPHSRDNMLARERMEDQRYNAIAENIRLTHSGRQRLGDSFGVRDSEGNLLPIRDRFEDEDKDEYEDEKYDAELENIRNEPNPDVRVRRMVDRFGSRGDYGVPDAIDSYIADPPLPASDQSKERQTMDDMSFMDAHIEGGNAILTVIDPHTQKTTVLKNLNLATIELVTPVLAFSFEESRSGPKYSIEDVSLTAVLCMLRHVYTCDHYVPNDCLHDQMSVLLHIEIFNLASIYDISSLKTMVKARIFLELELSTSYPGPPKDLCKALAYAYKHLPNEHDITKTLAHYCITCFLQHRLNEDELFTTFHYNCLPFQRDLVLILRENRFEDECAPTLIQLPVKTPDLPKGYPAVFDADPQAGFLEDEFDSEVKRRTNISRLDKLRIHFHIALPLR